MSRWFARIDKQFSWRRRLEFDELEQRLVPTLMGQQLFPFDNPWNQVIANAPVASNSAAVISNIGLTQELHPDFGQLYGTHDDLYGIPFNVVDGSTVSHVSVIIDAYDDQSDLGPVPIPANAVIEGDYQDGPKTYEDKDGGDSHLLVWDSDTNIAYELYHAQRPSDTADGLWHADGQAIWNMNTNQFRTLGWTSADAAGLSILAGLVRPDEGLPVAQGGQGVITHAIRFTITNSKVLGKYIYPASHEANSGTNTTNQVPMGTRFRLKASVNIDHFNPQAKIIAQAMKTYGLILADNGSSMYFSGASQSKIGATTLTWDDDDIQDQAHGLKFLDADDFEVVDLTPRITSLSQTSAQPGTTITVTGQNFSGSASSGGPNRLWVRFGTSNDVQATFVDDTHVTVVVPSISPTTLSLRVRSGVVDPEGGNILDPIFGYGDSNAVSFTVTAPTFPIVQSINRVGSNPSNGSSVQFTVTFNASVNGVDSSDFALTTTGVSGASVSTVTGSGATRTVTVNTGSGSGTIRLDVVDNDSIVHATNGLVLGDTGAGNGNFTAGQVFSIDKVNPLASSIVRAGSNPTGASSVAFTVTFNESVTGVNATDFTLTTSGVSGASVGTITGSGTTYTVNVNTGTGSGTIRLDLLDDDTIVDAAGNPLNGGLTTGEVYTIDKTLPSVSSIVRASTNPTNASSVAYTVTFSESVTGVNAADFTLTVTGVSGATLGTVTGSGATYTVNVNTGSGSGTIRLDVTDNDSIQDSAGNRLGGTGTGNGNFTTGEVYTIDKTAPSVSSIVRASTNPTNASSVAFTVTFSESVTGVNAADFNLTVTGVSGATLGTVSGGGTTWTVNVNTGSGSGTIRLNLTDDDSIQDGTSNRLGGTGNGNGNFTTGEVYDIDRTNPSVSSIVRADPNPTNADSVAFTVTFSESVTGVNAADFALTTNGVSGAGIDSVTGSGTTCTVNVDTGTGSGTIRLDLADDDSIQDAVGNVLGGSGAGNGSFTGGEVYDIDKTAPTVTVEEAAGQDDSTTESPILFTVTFSESVSNFDGGDVTFGGTADPQQVQVTGAGTTYTVAVSGMKRPGSVTVSVAAGVASDAVGNANSASTSIDNTVDYLLPPERVAVFRNGRWWHDDGDRVFNETPVVLGKKGDKPVRGDFDGDGVEDNGVFRGAGNWIIDLDHDGDLDEGRYAKYGTTGDKPVVGDWDGDGDDDLGVYRVNKYFLDDGDLLKNEAALAFGKKGYQPVVGDWDGDGDDDVGLFRQGRWYRDTNGDNLFNDTFFATYGQAGDKALAGDWDGDGTTDLGVWRNGTCFLDDDGDFSILNDNDTSFTYGVKGDKPLAER